MTNNLLDTLGIDWLGVVVAREDVEANDTTETLQSLWSVFRDRETVRKFQGRVEMGFHGYDADPREVFEIPEIRRFCRKLDKSFPYWFYFLPSDGLISPTLSVMASCLCSVTKHGPGLISLGPGFPAFLMSHFAALNELVDRYSLGVREKDRISGQVDAYFRQHAVR